MFAASNNTNSTEVLAVWSHGRFHAGPMTFTALMVVGTDFLIGVVSALILYSVLHRFMDRPRQNLSYAD